MLYHDRANAFYWIVLSVVVLAALLVGTGQWHNLLAASGFIPHGHCYLWRPGLVWLHVSSDTLIGAAYVAISATLAYLVFRNRREIPFHWMFLAFGAFIVACGATHFMAVVTLWNPVYWLSGSIKAVTAVASVATALVLPPLVPQVRSLLQAAKTSDEHRLKLETANRELEALYQRVKELDEAKTQFFANVSHELRTPLALILGPTEKLLHDEGLSPEQQQYLQVIERQARGLLSQVNDLLDISKLEAGQVNLRYREADLSHLVRLTTAYFESMARERQIDFQVEIPASLPAQVDPDKLHQVLLNLLSNAFKFTPTQGQIRCTLQLGLTANQPDRALFTIQDSGPGVPVEQQALIFQRFYSQQGDTASRFGSTGLGLAIVKDLIELHQGQVSVTDAAIGGACFTVELPLQAPAGVVVEAKAVELDRTEADVHALLEALQSQTAAFLPPAPRPGAPEADHPVVLVVEDNPDMNWFITQALAADYRVVSAQDGLAGLEQAIACQPDLILSDLMMPRLDGAQLMQRLRSHPVLAEIPVILLTAKTDRKLEISLLRQGAQDYLTKPFSVEELQVRVRNLVAMQQTRKVLQTELASQGQDVVKLANELALRKQDLQRALEELGASESRFRRAIQDAPIPVAMHAVDGEVLSLSTTWTELTGYTLADIPTIADWLERAYGERSALIQRQVERLYQLEQRLDEGEFTITTATGEQRIWDFSSAPLGQLPDGRALVITMARDITDHKQLEATLRRQAEELSQMNRMKDEFLAILSHELRTPLNSILGWANLLQTREFDTITTRRALETIARNGRLQSQLVEDLLEISRIIQGKLRLCPRAIDLIPVLESALEAVGPAAVAKGITLTFHSLRADQTGIPFLFWGDSDRLQQIVWNLLSNAIKFTPEGGQVEILLERQSGKSKICPDSALAINNDGDSETALSTGDFVQLTVRDTGIGIAPELIPFVFDRFRQGDSSTTRPYSGLGLGLAIVRHLVELHGGTVWAESGGKDQGATFIVRFPLRQAALSESEGDLTPAAALLAAAQALPLAGLRALVVDDDADTQEFLVTVLEEYGMTVIASSSAKQALQAIAQSRLTGRQIDILISDIGMPGEDGYTLMRQVRRLEPLQGGQIPAIALTAYASEEDSHQAMLVGFQLHLPKPVEPARLIAAVAALTGRCLSATEQN